MQCGHRDANPPKTEGRLRRTAAVLSTAALCLTSFGAGSTGAAATPLVGHASGAAPALLTPTTAGWTTNFSYNYFSTSFPTSLFNNLVLLPLAIAQPPNQGTYVPELASAWHVRASTITVSVRKDARWQDGKPVTSADVTTTFLLDGLEAAPIWQEVTSMSAQGSHAVVFHLKPGVPALEAESNILNTIILPTSEYGQFVPAGLQKLDLAAASGGAGAAAAQNRLSAIFKRLASFAPSTMVGDGPFRLDHLTLSDGTLSRWSGFWDAKSVRVPAISMFNATSDNLIYPLLLEKKVDITNVAMNHTIDEQWLRTPDSHDISPSAMVGNAIYFNSRHYPLNILDVRKAIAYLINRQEVLAAGFGSDNPMHFPKYNSGISHILLDKWVSQADIRTLTVYRRDPAKATKLLEAAGMHRRGGQWYLPDGKQFTLTMDGPASFAAAPPEVEYIAGVLTRSGIKTTATTQQNASYFAAQQQGNFVMDWGWTGNGGNLNPLGQLDGVLGSALNFTTTGTYHGDPGVGFGPVKDVPGLGRVNVPDTLDTEAAKVTGGTKLRQLTWDWVRLVNEQLPFLMFSDKHDQLHYSTEHYIDWPRPSSSIWLIEAVNGSGGLLVMLEKGYVRPR